MRKTTFWILGCVLLLAGASPSCSDDSQTLDTGGGKADGSTDLVAPPDQGIDQPWPDLLQPDQVMTKKLTDTHSGWRQPLCFSCHVSGGTAVYTHTDESYEPPDCAPCHGYNGAPHPTHGFSIGGCAGCHGNSHMSVFNETDDCMACHFHPGE
jgi:hypothetical protein